MTFCCCFIKVWWCVCLAIEAVADRHSLLQCMRNNVKEEITLTFSALRNWTFTNFEQFAPLFWTCAAERRPWPTCLVGGTRPLRPRSTHKDALSADRLCARVIRHRSTTSWRPSDGLKAGTDHPYVRPARTGSPYRPLHSAVPGYKRIMSARAHLESDERTTYTLHSYQINAENLRPKPRRATLSM